LRRSNALRIDHSQLNLSGKLAETGMLPANAIRLMPEFLPGETV